MGPNDLVIWAVAASASAGIAAGLYVALRAKCFVTVPPTRALVLPGRRSAPADRERRTNAPDVVNRSPRILVGGGAYVAPWNRSVGELSLEPVSVEVTVRSVQSLEGARASGWQVRLLVEAKVPNDPRFLANAAESLFGKNEEEVRAVVRRSVEGAVPAVLAHLSAEDAASGWAHLAAELEAAVAPDLVPWGLALRTLSVVELLRIGAADAVHAPLPARPPSAPLAETLRGEGFATPWATLEVRIARIERSLGILGAELLRRGSEDRPPFDPSLGLSVLDVPLGWEAVPQSVGSDPPAEGPHGSTVGDRSPRPRSALSGAERPVGRPALGPPVE